MKEREIKIGNQYHHFKGHNYIVKEICYDSEHYDEENPNNSRMVVYEDVDRKICWVRPYEMFNSLVDKEKYPNVEQEYRFELIERGE